MKFDFVVVGSGPAGSIISEELSKNGFNIALIDRASYESPRSINHFFCPYIDKTPNFYTPVFSNVLGGNSLLWHSKVYLLSKQELSNYNWHIKYKELKKFSNILSKKLKINNSLMTKFEEKRNFLYRYSYRASFRNIFKHLNIEQKDKIKVFKGYSPIKLNITKNSVRSVIIKNIHQKKQNIFIKHDLIFCCGGLGNAHILLNLIKKKNKNLGRFLSDHPHINLGKIQVSELNKFKKILKPNIKLDLKINSHETALILKNKGYFCGIQLDYKIDPMRTLIRFFIKIKNLKFRIFLNFFGLFVRKINGLFHKFGIIFGRYYKYSLEFFFSQNPDLRNKIYLTNKYDKFGLIKINIKWDLE